MVNIKSDRRGEPRPDSEDRRRFPRPPVWLNVALLGLAIVVGVLAIAHRNSLQERSEELLMQADTTPVEVNEVRAELAEMDLTAEELRRELEARQQLIANLDSDEFYLAIDTEEKKLLFHYGDDVLREMDVQVGENLTVEGSDGQPWHFVPVKGAFEVEGKSYNPEWQAEEWVYLMNDQDVPETLPSIPTGLGRYVVHLPHDYIIHTEPAEESPLDGPKPGSFMVEQSDMRAIWPRITKGMKIYIF